MSGLSVKATTKRRARVKEGPKTIFFVGGGVECVEGIVLAKQQGLQVVVSDVNPEAPGSQLADRFIQASVYDSQETLKAVQALPEVPAVNGVLTLGCDVPHTVAAVAQYFGLPGLSMSAAHLTTHKLRMKERLQSSGIRVPWFTWVTSHAELHRLCEQRTGIKVLKPVDSRGARGVLRLDDDVDLGWAYKHSLAYSPSGELILEEWIEGRQISTESVLWDQRAVLCGIADRDYSRTTHLLPFVIEDGGETPADLDEPTVAEIADMVHAAARVLGVERGTVKADIVLVAEGPTVVEIAARLSGGYFCTYNIPLVYGVDLVGTAISMALGQEPDWSILVPRVHQYVANRFIFLREGTVKSVRYDKSLAQQPGVALFRLYVKPGDRIEKVTDHTKRRGTVITSGNTRQEAIGLAENVIKSVHIEME